MDDPRVERIVEAMARAIATACGHEWGLLSNLGRDGYYTLARAALAALTALPGVVVTEVPEPEKYERSMDASSRGVVVGHNACRAEMLAKAVRL